MVFRSCRDLIAHHKNFIRGEMIRRIGLLPHSRFQDFACRTAEGPQRIGVWIELVIGSLDGHADVFYADSEKIGYARATSGFEFDFIHQFYDFFRQIFSDLLGNAVDRSEITSDTIYKEILELDSILFRAYSIVSDNFLKTRLEELENGRQELHFLAGKIITIQEEERKRLANDIHDSLAQTLTGIGYKIQLCKELVNKDARKLSEELDRLLSTVHQAMDQSRELISSLRPDLIDTMGLVPALRRHIESFQRETGLRVHARLPRALDLPAGSSICLFRIAQESLMNVYKHAEVDDVEFILRKSRDSVILSVSDKGKGFTATGGNSSLGFGDKLGLLSMKERVEAVGGTLTIDAKVNQGCSIRAQLPLGS